VFIAVSADLLRQIVQGAPVTRSRLLMGYAGWGPGQLDRELTESSWLISEVSPELVFDTPSTEMWEAAIRKLGVDPAALHASSGIH
jgi:putative transcriptional regulator